MKKIVCAVIVMLFGQGLFAQTVSKDDAGSVCSVFDPAMWENSSRDPLRQELIVLGGPLKGKTVLDIGAGSGYFTFEFSKYADRVIATELDERFLDYIQRKSASLEVGNIETRLATAKQDELVDLGGVDVTVMVLVYHFLDDPRAFLSKLKREMNKGGRILIVNGEHFSSRFITDYLEAVGFKDVSVRKFTMNGSCGPERLNIVSARNL